MIQTRLDHGSKSVTGWNINKPLLTIPKITGSKVVGGDTFYECENGKLYEPVAFDKMFKVSRGIVLPRYSK